MNNIHLTEAALQQYAMDPSACQGEMAVHLQSCEDCQASLQAYQALFSGLSAQPRPGFDFDVTASVLEQLDASKKGISLSNLFIYMLAMVAIASPIIAAIKYRVYLKNLGTGMGTMTIYLLILTAACVIIFQGLDLFRKYQKQINLLNNAY